LSKKYVGNRALDAGAGSGALIKRIPNAIGLDLVSRDARTVKGDISNMPFMSSSFDTVFATELLEDLSDQTLSKGLDEIRRVLKPGGAVIITVPCKEDLRQSMMLCLKSGA